MITRMGSGKRMRAGAEFEDKVRKETKRGLIKREDRDHREGANKKAQPRMTGMNADREGTIKNNLSIRTRMMWIQFGVALTGHWRGNRGPSEPTTRSRPKPERVGFSIFKRHGRQEAKGAKGGEKN